MTRTARWRASPGIAATTAAGDTLDVAADGAPVPVRRGVLAPDARFYAMALDGDQAPVASIASNPGHCLWSGIVRRTSVAAVAERLLAPDLFSGWGIRTYAAGQPGYNPIGYHTGSVWPHDNALIAAGLKASGAADAADLLRRAA